MARASATRGAAPLVAYRRVGGMAGLNQRLTVFEDGTVALDDRRAGSSATAVVAAGELESLRAALDAIPARSWRPRWRLALRRLLPTGHHEGMRAEIRRGGRGIAVGGGAHGDAEAQLTAQLDDVLARAVREGRGPGLA
jgi:hypothetical protein